MNIKFLLTVILFLNVGFQNSALETVQSKKNIVVTYKKFYKNFKDLTDSKPKYIEGLDYRLLIEKGVKGRFELIQSLKLDYSNRRFIGKGGGRGVYYTDIVNKEKLHQITNPFDKEIFVIKHDFNGIKWNLMKETKIIGNYNCFKATAIEEYISPVNGEVVEREIVAWYTNQIPLPFGPAGYDGLPGLVLEKHSGSFYFVVSNIDFDPVINDSSSIEKPDGKLVEEHEYIEYSKKALKKFADED